MAKALHFKSSGAYRRWLAYGHMRTKTGKRAGSPSRSVFATTPGSQEVYIGGKRHHVEHCSKYTMGICSNCGRCGNK